MWVGVGAMLLSLSYTWLRSIQLPGSLVFAGMGLSLALVVHHFGFLRIVDKNLGRILPMKGKKCLFSFMSWKSYFLVAVMAAMGIRLRHSSIPKSYLSVLYIGIGMALILSSIRYLRVFYRQMAASPTITKGK